MRYRFIALALCLLSAARLPYLRELIVSLANLSPTEKRYVAMIFIRA